MYIIEPIQSPVIPVLNTRDFDRAVANAAISCIHQVWSIHKKLVEFKSSVKLLKANYYHRASETFLKTQTFSCIAVKTSYLTHLSEILQITVMPFLMYLKYT